MGRLPDGRAVFVPFTLPGERVRVRLVEEKRGFARAELLEVLEPSPDRIEPRCPEFTLCGGCDYAHMPYSLQLTAKRDILRDQLTRIGGIQDPPMEAVVPSPKQWHYRNNVQFHLDTEGRLGCQERRSNKVVPMQVSLLAEEPINEIFPLLKFDPGSGIERVSLRADADGDLILILESENIETPELTIEELPISVVHLSPAGALVLAGSGEQAFELAGRSFVVSAESFFQVNTLVAEKMVEHILQILPLLGDSSLLELYCGAGLFSAFLAPKVGRLVGIESSPSACEDFAVNLDEFENVELYEAPVEEALPHLDLKPDLVLADPPRAGMGPKVVEQVLRMAPRVLVYVSCDPSTLARDAKRLLEGGYRLERVTPFDMFPQTYHIESISLFVKA
jgi:23S rRNA (uracil1939-C5)-methyltransferase